MGRKSVDIEKARLLAEFYWPGDDFHGDGPEQETSNIGAIFVSWLF